MPGSSVWSALRCVSPTADPDRLVLLASTPMARARWPTRSSICGTRSSRSSAREPLARPLCFDDWALGLGVCYDGCFPEHARAASDAGALAYVCPSAYLVGSEHRRDLYYAARALDNGIYVRDRRAGRPLRMLWSSAEVRRSTTRRAAWSPGSSRARASRSPTSSWAVVEEARRINPYERDRPASLGGRTRVVLRRLRPSVTAERRQRIGQSELTPRYVVCLDRPRKLSRPPSIPLGRRRRRPIRITQPVELGRPQSRRSRTWCRWAGCPNRRST